MPRISVLTRETLVFTGLFIMVYTIFSGFESLGRLAIIPAVFIVVLIFSPLKAFLENIADKYLFAKKYDYKHLLKTFADEVLTVLGLRRLVNLTVNKLTDIMRLENALIMLYDEANGELKLVSSAGSVMPEYAFGNNSFLSSYVDRIGQYSLWKSPVAKDALKSEIEKNIGKLSSFLAVPIEHHGNMIGVLLLGKRKSDGAFTQDDIDIILTLVKTLSIAITNAKLFNRLSEAQAQAAQREKMAVIGTLSAGINHEICNPLGIARGQCEMFLLNMADGFYKDKQPEELLEKAQDIMQKVIHETDRATLITKKLASFARPSKGKIMDDVSVEDELDKVISLVEQDLKLDNITVEKELEPHLPRISADAKQVQEIFFNIIRNAAQSIKEKGRIIIRAVSVNETVNIDIEDTGEGISRGNLDQIFNPFFTTKEPGGASGLGLFIVKQIVEKNNGRIAVESEIGKGTIFRLAFRTGSSAGG